MTKLALHGMSLVAVAATACVTLGFAVPATSVCGAEPQDVARKIVQATGVRGGLVVHLGCGDGRLTAALRTSDKYLVHGLDTDAENVQQAREYIQSLGLYGDVSVAQLSGTQLPYVDNLVSLLVIDGTSSIDEEEINRVLSPGGAAIQLDPDTRNLTPETSTRKPRPAAIDEWTHFLYDATNNAVADDSMVGPPRQLQWVGDPRWARSHDHLASISAAVSSGSRLFYIVDEGPTAAIVLEPQWQLVARDAFNGVVLWKRPIASWEYHLRGFRSGPSDLSRRLVAVGNRVYVTLSIDGPLVALDAATGETVTTYAGTEGAREVLHHAGTLFVVAGEVTDQAAIGKAARRGQRPGFTEVRSQRPAYSEPPPVKRIVVLDAESGRQIWKKSDADTTELMPATLAVGGDRVFFQNADEILCLRAKSGDEVWRSKRPVSRTRPTWTAPTLVVYDDVVLSADRAVAERKPAAGDDARKVEWIVASAGGQAPVGELIAFSAANGERLWSCKCRECYNAPVDVLVANSLVWLGDTVRASDPGVTEGRDPKTGEVKRTRPKDQTFFAAGMGHGRCYRNKATNRYLVLGRSGVEFIDVESGAGIPHHWTRGTCQYGVIPCNGLLYVPPHSCACFIRSKLNGFNCFAPERTAEYKGQSTKAEGQHRLQQGPAFDGAVNLKSEISNLKSDAWPTYRSDGARSGATASSVPAELSKGWETALGGRLSSVTMADGKVFAAQVDTHTVHALDAENGERIWSYTADGRVDSPPTIWQGRALFGSADGCVYCLRASDGALVWRFRAAPDPQQITAYGQLESAWPVHGSVLVYEGVVYCAAGRSSYLDGGIRMCRLDTATGRLLSETVIDHRDPETGTQRKGSVTGTNMPGALPDVLSSGGESVFMRHTRFDLAGRLQPPDVPHLFSAAGFLDDSWWHRTYWMIGTIMTTNYGGWPQVGSRVPAGRLLAMDESSVYGFGRSQYIHHGAHVGLDGATVFHFRADRDSPRRFTHYQAFAIDRKPAEAGPKQPRARTAPEKNFRWTEKLPVLARALVLAEDKLFLAGPPDIFTSDEPAATLAGERGGLLCVLSGADGKVLAQHELASPPVFDGMAAAGKRLYMATMDGKVICLK